ncbi:MAG TPA: toluene-4-monooxygenase system B family protein [Polyangia bacterium]|nr:toluene-4-monooxygenase system B family protein [Polyangia bacterium]
MPVYGFLEGDTIGLLILARKSMTVAQLAQQLQSAASVRVAPRPGLRVVYKEKVLDPADTLEHVGLSALERFDVIV